MSTTTGEFIVGAEQTGSHACYLIYGTMTPREKERELRAGKGHEEIFLAVNGDFSVTCHASSNAPGVTGHVMEGQAFHLKGDETYRLENITDYPAIYVMAGGHSEHGGHGHH